jgi:solute:Na+ symporter, SSS family
LTTGFTLSALDIAIIAISLIFVTVVGLLASRRQDRSAHAYFLASGSLPWWMIGTALIATSVSSEQIVGTMGAAYTYGMGITNWEWWTLPTYTIVILFFIPVYLKTRVTTVPDYLSRRFGERCGDIYSWVMLGAYVVVFMVPILYGGSLAFSALTGWNFYAVLWTTVILVGLYTVKGGLASVVWTDMVQCLMLVGGGVVLYLKALSGVPGGWHAMMQANPERFHLYHPPSDPIAPFLALIFLALGLGPFYQGTNQVMVQRILGARSTWDGIMGTIFAGFINFLRPMITVFPGFIAWHWIHNMHEAPALDNTDMTFPFVLKTVGPAWGFRGIVLTGFLAAVMSAISALANSTATIFALSVYKRSIRPNAEDRELVTAGRIASFVALAAAAMMAPAVEQFGGIFRYFQTGVTYVATPFISVILPGLLWKRANYQGALFGIIGGVVIQAVVASLTAAANLNVHWLYSGFAAEVLTITGVVVVSLRTPPPAESTRALVWNCSLLKVYKSGGGRPWYKGLLLWFGVYASIWFYLYWRFW